MARACTEINWRYIGDSIPAFLTMALMPFTYSIAYGLIVGIVTYFILNTGAWLIAVVSGGRIVPHDHEHKDYWTYKVRGGLLPGWVKRAARGKRDFWREWDFDAEELGSRDSYVLARKERGSGSVMTNAGGGVVNMAASMPVEEQQQQRQHGAVSMDGIITGDRRWEMDSSPGYPLVSTTTNKGDVRATQTSSPSRR